MAAISLFSLFLLMLVISYMVSGWTARRAAVKVVHRFCKFNALDVHEARTKEELGLKSPGMVARITKMRDYKPFAVEYLKKLGIVRATDDGKLYLLNKKLNPALRCPIEGNGKGKG